MFPAVVGARLLAILYATQKIKPRHPGPGGGGKLGLRGNGSVPDLD